jgi:hypothetical protein
LVTRGIRDLILPLFLKMEVKRIREVYSHTVDWNKRVATSRHLIGGEMKNDW